MATDLTSRAAAAPPRGLLIDLDGVVFTGGDPIPGAGWFLAEARRRGLPFLLVTNNSTTRPEGVSARLASMNIEARPEEILTSADAAAAYVRDQEAGTRVLVVGEAGLRDSVTRVGLEAVDEPPADWVVAGLDRAFDYRKLSAATQAILAGARFIATNADALLPIEGGGFLPGAGTMIAAIRAATDVEPVVIGKPEPAMFQRGVDVLGGLAAHEVAMVGDRLDTDIDGGRRAGLQTILVLTGVTTAALATASPIQADYTLPDIAAVATLYGWPR